MKLWRFVDQTLAKLSCLMRAVHERDEERRLRLLVKGQRRLITLISCGANSELNLTLVWDLQRGAVERARLPPDRTFSEAKFDLRVGWF